MSSKTPIIRQVSWIYILPQLAIMAAFMAATQALLHLPNFAHSMIIGLAAYLIYSHGMRVMVLRVHRRAMGLVRRRDFRGAIKNFEESYRSLSQQPWVDRFRWIILLSPSSIGYREMDLYNIAYCYIQLNQPAEARTYYEKVIGEFPNGSLAPKAQRMLQALGKGQSVHPAAKSGKKGKKR
jgi:tetratricopeptide (TPR) repeat protein